MADDILIAYLSARKSLDRQSETEVRNEHFGDLTLFERFFGDYDETFINVSIRESFGKWIGDYYRDSLVDYATDATTTDELHKSLPRKVFAPALYDSIDLDGIDVENEDVIRYRIEWRDEDSEDQRRPDTKYTEAGKFAENLNQEEINVHFY